MELSTSRINGSNVKTVNSWHLAFNVVSSVLKSLYNFVFFVFVIFKPTRGWDGF